MTRGAVVALGIGQCVNWGVLYYAFPVLVLPLGRELAVPAWVVTGAFSLALLVSAVLAPAVGRRADRGHGPVMMQAGGILAPVLLAGWTFVPGAVGLYVVWAGLGLCMAATLYEPAFVVIARAHDNDRTRLRALAAVTLFGGLASSVFLPLTASLAAAAGWRGAVLALAALLLLSTGVAHVLVFRHLPASAANSPGSDARLPVPDRRAASGRFLFISVSFALASLASAGLTANLVPACGDRGMSPRAAATLGGLMGIMQLPGRALLMNGTLAGSPARLVAISLLVSATGLFALAFVPSLPATAAGALAFALGAGLATVVRPYAIQTLFAGAGAGYLNGRMATHQQFARATGPLAVAWLGARFDYSVAFALLGAAFLAGALMSACVLGGRRR